jgi:hypothetical protein
MPTTAPFHAPSSKIEYLSGYVLSGKEQVNHRSMLLLLPSKHLKPPTNIFLSTLTIGLPTTEGHPCVLIRAFRIYRQIANDGSNLIILNYFSFSAK